MKWMIIRHGETKGNSEKRYIGITDEPLQDEGIQKLIEKKKSGVYEEAEDALKKGALLYISPLLRCRMTAEILFPGQNCRTEEGLREIDFGAFEGKSYEELNGTEQYQSWIESGGEKPFPEGESKESFTQRIREAMEKIEEETLKTGQKEAVIVAHGGTIMAAREILTGGAFYDGLTENGAMYVVEAGDMRCS